MSNETLDYEDEDTTQRPRTMRRRPQAAVEDTGDYESDDAPVASTDTNDSSEEEGGGLIHSGWTAGQNVMDSSSTYAQGLVLDGNIQIIKFLEDQPYANYRRHWVDRVGPKGPYKRAYTCLETVGKTCPLCGIADRPQAVSAFNVALVGDDGQVLLKTWDVGVKLFGTLKSFANDPKFGPLTKGYFAVNKTGKAQTTQYNVIPIRETAMQEDYDMTPPSADILKRVGKYDSSIIQIPKKADLEEIAQEISDYD